LKRGKTRLGGSQQTFLEEHLKFAGEAQESKIKVSPNENKGRWSASPPTELGTGERSIGLPVEGAPAGTEERRDIEKKENEGINPGRGPKWFYERGERGRRKTGKEDHIIENGPQKLNAKKYHPFR